MHSLMLMSVSMVTSSLHLLIESPPPPYVYTKCPHNEITTYQSPSHCQHLPFLQMNPIPQENPAGFPVSTCNNSQKRYDASLQLYLIIS